jgi:hypothetical protein
VNYLSPFDCWTEFSSMGIAVAVGVGCTGTGARVGCPDFSAIEGASVVAADGADEETAGTMIGALDGADDGAVRLVERLA